MEDYLQHLPKSYAEIELNTFGIIMNAIEGIEDEIERDTRILKILTHENVDHWSLDKYNKVVKSLDWFWITSFDTKEPQPIFEYINEKWLIDLNIENYTMFQWMQLDRIFGDKNLTYWEKLPHLLLTICKPENMLNGIEWSDNMYKYLEHFKVMPCDLALNIVSFFLQIIQGSRDISQLYSQILMEKLPGHKLILLDQLIQMTQKINDKMTNKTSDGGPSLLQLLETIH